MKELLKSIENAYENYRGTGKLVVLFLVAVLIIYIINSKEDETGIERKINPGLFLLSLFSGIAYAFTAVYEYAVKKRIKALYGILMVGFIMLMIILSGTRVFSKEFFSEKENDLHIKQEYVDVMDRILAEGDNPRVVAAPEVIPYFKMYSSRFETIYDYPENGDLSLLDADERYIYEQMMSSTPDETRVVKVMREKDCNYIIYDVNRNYFELPLEGYGMTLIDTVGNYKIYRDNEGEG